MADTNMINPRLNQDRISLEEPFLISFLVGFM